MSVCKFNHHLFIHLFQSKTSQQIKTILTWIYNFYSCSTLDDPYWLCWPSNRSQRQVRIFSFVHDKVTWKPIGGFLLSIFMVPFWWTLINIPTSVATIISTISTCSREELRQISPKTVSRINASFFQHHPHVNWSHCIQDISTQLSDCHKIWYANIMHYFITQI